MCYSSGFSAAVFVQRLYSGESQVDSGTTASSGSGADDRGLEPHLQEERKALPVRSVQNAQKECVASIPEPTAADADPPVFSGDKLPPPVMILSANGIQFTIEVPALQLCAHSAVKITATGVASPLRDVDVDTLDLSVFAVFYTNASVPGTACDVLDSLNCTRLTRQLPLWYNNKLDAIVAVFVPDTSSRHYSFVFQVRFGIPA